jgi:hypothetical protein
MDSKKVIFEKEVNLESIDQLDLFSTSASAQSPNGKYIYIGTTVSESISNFIYIIDMNEGITKSILTYSTFK